MTPKSPPRHRSQQGMVSKVDKILALYAQDLAVRLSPRSVESYLAGVRSFVSWLALKGISLLEVRTADLVAYQGELHSAKQRDGKLYAMATQSCRLGAVRHFFRFLLRRGYLIHDPGALLELPRLPTRLPRVILTTREVNRILEAPDDRTATGLRDRAILETLYATGIRVAELCSLKLEDVETEERVLRVVQGKGRKDRNVPLTRAAAEAIEAYLEDGRARLASRASPPALFLGGMGFSLQRATVGLIVKRAAAVARVKKPVSPHTFRHTVATHLLRGRADIRHIQALLGHRSLATTQRYTRVEIQDLKRAVERAHPRGR